MLISAKVNQWTLLIGSLPVAYMLGGGSAAMRLDGRQIEEIVLTAAQTLMGVTLLLGLRFQRWAAWALLGLFVVQFPLTSTEGRLALSGVYAVIARGGPDPLSARAAADVGGTVRGSGQAARRAPASAARTGAFAVVSGRITPS